MTGSQYIKAALPIPAFSGKSSCILGFADPGPLWFPGPSQLREVGRASAQKGAFWEIGPGKEKERQLLRLRDKGRNGNGT